MSNCFIILAAGNSNRFISKIPKPYIKYKGDILINHSINKAILSKKFSKIIVAVNRTHKKYYKMNFVFIQFFYVFFVTFVDCNNDF